MDIKDRVDLVSRNTEEIITREELETVLQNKSRPKAYWGFECSGLMHIGMGLVVGTKIRDMINAGFDFTIFLADWHSLINNKLGGNMDSIRTCGNYFIDCFTAIGIPKNKVRYVWASELTGDKTYWEKVIRIGKSASITRIMRALPIMGRSMNSSDMEAASVIYPCMQAADIFQMELDVACAGIDQRKAHMLARDVADKLGLIKPVCLHTPLLAGLQEPQAAKAGQFDENKTLDEKISSKMSKSVAASSISIHDDESQVEAKIKAAYCPPKAAAGNPILEIARLVIFPISGVLRIPRAEKHGGPIRYSSYSELELSYGSGSIHPLDLKLGVSSALSEILKEPRNYFAQHPENLASMKRIELTR